nr:helicase and polymerase-containing protein tebichi [Quercus suber]
MWVKVEVRKGYTERFGLEGSPSAKGTLDNYLVTSEDDNNNAKASHTTRDSLSRLDAVKRNLAFEINNSSKDEQVRPSSQVQLHSKAVEVANKEAFREIPVVDDVSVGGLAEGYSTSAQAVENPELKKFATNFLSLYCSSGIWDEVVVLFLYFLLFIMHSKAVEVANKEAFREIPVVDDVSVGGLAEGYSTSAQAVENPELKKFATNFLSLYCSEFQSNVKSRSELEVNNHKRHCSPSWLDEKYKTSKKRHCNSNQSLLECEITCSNKKIPKDMQSVLVDKTMRSIFGSSREVADGNGPIELQAFLKKCSNTPESSVKMKEFCTLALLMVKACAHETPRSMCGSSVFSSGEAFWNEKIQLADGLCDPMIDISAQAAEETNISKSQCKTVNSCSLRNGICHDKSKETSNKGENRAAEETNISKSQCKTVNSCSLRNGICHDKSKETSNKGENRVWHTELITSLGSLGKHTKDLDKEVSLLPVKHLDFSFRDKNLDESTPHCPVDGSECASHRGGAQSECGSVGHKGLETGNTSIRCDKVQTNEEMHEGKEMTSVVALTKRKVDLLCPNNDCMTSKPPVIEIKDSNHMTSNSLVNEVKNLNLDYESDGASTPSSFVPLEDRLDLNR